MIPCIAGGRSHVSHVLHTVDGLFQRSDNTFLKGFRTGTIVSGAHHDGGRRNVGILLNGQGEQSDDAQNDNRNGDDCRKNGAFYKSSEVHILSVKNYHSFVLGWTEVPSRSKPTPSATIVSPTFKPLSTIYS